MYIADRRKTRRWQLDSQAKLILEDSQESVSCRIIDINFQGLQLSSPKELEKDSFLRISLDFAQGFSLKDIETWVSWRKHAEGTNFYGLYFSRISEEQKEAVYQFVFRHFRESSDKSGQQKPQEGGELMQNMESEAEDKRVFARFPVNLALKFLDLLSNQEGQASAQDISAKGIGFVTNQELKPLTPLEMWLNVPDKGSPLYTRGEVAWSQMQSPTSYKIGINLERADLMGMSRILRTIRTSS